MRTAVLALLLAAPACQPEPANSERPRATATGPRVSVRVRADLAEGPLQGRLLVLFARGSEPEPRFLVREDDSTAQVFGLDVEGWSPEAPLAFAGDIAGAPRATFESLPPGEYTVQAVLHRYETFHRGDGHVVRLPPDRGEGQQWNHASSRFSSTISCARRPREPTRRAGGIEIVRRGDRMPR